MKKLKFKVFDKEINLTVEVYAKLEKDSLSIELIGVENDCVITLDDLSISQKDRYQRIIEEKLKNNEFENL